MRQCRDITRGVGVCCCGYSVSTCLGQRKSSGEASFSQARHMFFFFFLIILFFLLNPRLLFL